MEDFQQRVVDEKADLDAKIEALGSFNKNSPLVSAEERSRLSEQLVVMRRYSAILGERLGAIPKPPKDAPKSEPAAKPAPIEEAPPVAAPAVETLPTDPPA